MTAASKPGRTTVVGTVASRIGAAIVCGDYLPDQTLPVEAELAQQFAVGRNAVREAIKLLVGKGLVRTRGRGGTLVEPTERWNRLDADVLTWSIERASVRAEMLVSLTDLRAILEPEAAAIAATVGTPAQILLIMDAMDRMERYVADRERAIEADVDFHNRLFEASGNPLIASLSRAVALLLRAVFERTAGSSGGYLQSLPQHRAVVEAIHRRDPAAAREATRILLANNERDLRIILDAEAAQVAA